MSDNPPELIRLERRDLDMLLTYQSGEEFTVTYDDIRYSCPCAKCSPLRNEDESIPSNVLASVDPVRVIVVLPL